MGHISNPARKTGESGLQSKTGVHQEFEASLRYTNVESENNIGKWKRAFLWIRRDIFFIDVATGKMLTPCKASFTLVTLMKLIRSSRGGKA